MRYKLTCKKCDMEHIHQTSSMKDIDTFWKNWNKQYGKDMKCIHEYIIEELLN